MLRLATDEDFNNRILRGLLRRNPALDIVRVQDVGLTGKSDAEVLEWAAREGRVLLTHDVTTMKRYVDARAPLVFPCAESLKSASKFLSPKPLKTYSYSLSVALRTSGKVRLDSFRFDRVPHVYHLIATRDVRPHLRLKKFSKNLLTLT